MKVVSQTSFGIATALGKIAELQLEMKIAVNPKNELFHDLRLAILLY
jgi:hypothetical protein